MSAEKCVTFSHWTWWGRFVQNTKGTHKSLNHSHIFASLQWGNGWSRSSLLCCMMWKITNNTNTPTKKLTYVQLHHWLENFAVLPSKIRDFTSGRSDTRKYTPWKWSVSIFELTISQGWMSPSSQKFLSVLNIIKWKKPHTKKATSSVFST